MWPGAAAEASTIHALDRGLEMPLGTPTNTVAVQRLTASPSAGAARVSLWILCGLRVVNYPQATRMAPQRQARSAHHRTSNTLPTASNKWVTPAVVTPPKIRNAQTTSATTAAISVSEGM